MGNLSPRSTHAYRPLSLKRRTWLTLGAVVLGGAGVVTVAVANPYDDDRPSAAASPVKMHTVPLKAKGAGKRGVDRRGTEPFSLLGISWPTSTATIEGTAEVRTHSVETGEWTGWQELDLDGRAPESEEGRESEARGATEPRWVGPSDGVEARVVAADGSVSDGLPSGLRLDLVDPGVLPSEAKKADRAAQEDPDGSDAHPAAYALPAEDTPLPSLPVTGEPTVSESPVPTSSESVLPTGSPTPSASESAGGSPSPSDSTSPSPTPTVPTAPPSTVTKPSIVSRAKWGADESKVDDPPTYLDKIDAAFVHHTTDANGYTCAETPAILRAIFTYHVQSNGWNDIGYNFLVDKCGTVYEGRAGGVDLPVMGAHTYGFNGYSTGISVIGNYATDGKATAPVLNAISRIAAYKLGQYGVDPTGKVTLTAAGDTGKYKKGEQATLSTISGHRDGYATECPGANLYSKLPEIRRFAASPAANAAPASTDLHQDGVADLVAGTPGVSGGVGSLTVVPGGPDGPVASAKQTLTQSSPGVPGSSESGDNFGADNALGDVNGDGHADLAIGAPGEDDTTGHTDAGAVTVLYGPALSSGTTYSTATATRAAGEKLGTSVTVADFNSDGKADVLSVAPGTPGRWWSYDGTTGAAKSGYLNSTAYTAAVSQVDSATGDFNRDGYADAAITFRDPGKVSRVLVLKGSATGLQRTGILGVRGGRSLAVGDLNGDGYTDAAVGQPYATESAAYKGGQITALYGSSTGLTTTGRTTVHQDTTGVPGAAETGDDLGYSVSVGDYNLDGYADVLAGLPGEDITRDGTARTNAGQALLLRGGSTGLTGSSALAYSQDTSGIAGATESGDRLGSSVVLHDLSGWGRADLAIGVEGEDAGDGVILQLDSGSSGVSTSTGVYYSRSNLGTPAGARLGQTQTP
ncbi:FG-GAP-like repeat-containing protein [Streptomyces sp. KR80]|uniref:FG-GAP-like repeat-containing protein n=1 Tax=Streptomyces sp. KR80 TaxID=3457426 RepID=UPI003FCF3403